MNGNRFPMLLSSVESSQEGHNSVVLVFITKLNRTT